MTGRIGTRLTSEPPPEVDRLAHRVISAALEVHQALGPGFLEGIYEAALCIELELTGIDFVRQAPVTLHYRNRIIGEGRVDILVRDLLIVELKSVDTLNSLHSAQLLAYLKATHRCLGLLINFNVPSLRQGIRRIVLTP